MTKKTFLGVKNVDGAIFGGVWSQWCGVRSRYVGFGAAVVGFGGQKCGAHGRRALPPSSSSVYSKVVKMFIAHQYRQSNTRNKQITKIHYFSVEKIINTYFGTATQ